MANRKAVITAVHMDCIMIGFRLVVFCSLIASLFNLSFSFRWFVSTYLLAGALRSSGFGVQQPGYESCAGSSIYRWFEVVSKPEQEYSYTTSVRSSSEYLQFFSCRRNGPPSTPLKTAHCFQAGPAPVHFGSVPSPSPGPCPSSETKVGPGCRFHDVTPTLPQGAPRGLDCFAKNPHLARLTHPHTPDIQVGKDKL